MKINRSSEKNLQAARTLTCCIEWRARNSCARGSKRPAGRSLRLHLHFGCVSTFSLFLSSSCCDGNSRFPSILFCFVFFKLFLKSSNQSKTTRVKLRGGWREKPSLPVSAAPSGTLPSDAEWLWFKPTSGKQFHFKSSFILLPHRDFLWPHSSRAVPLNAEGKQKKGRGTKLEHGSSRTRGNGLLSGVSLSSND